MRLLHGFNSLMATKRDRHVVRNTIASLTKISTDHLTPELRLRLITPQSALWKSRPEECPFADPFWAFYWAGGQALTRYILDNAALFEGSTVLDVGCGCGASSIAAIKVGAKKVYSNDIDIVACEAAVMNARLNSQRIRIIHRNVLNRTIPVDRVDYFLIGDMFYDSNFSSTVLSWLVKCKKHSRVLIGDPGRHGMMNVTHSKNVKLLAEYQLLEHTVQENNGFRTSSVWELL